MVKIVSCRLYTEHFKNYIQKVNIILQTLSKMFWKSIFIVSYLFLVSSILILSILVDDTLSN